MKFLQSIELESVNPAKQNVILTLSNSGWDEFKTAMDQSATLGDSAIFIDDEYCTVEVSRDDDGVLVDINDREKMVVISDTEAQKIFAQL